MLETPQNAASYDSSLLTSRMQNQQPSIRASWGKSCRRGTSQKYCVKIQNSRNSTKGPLNVNPNSLKDAFAIFSQLPSTVFVTYRILLVAADSLSFTFVWTKAALLKPYVDSEKMRCLSKTMSTAIGKSLMRNLDCLDLWVASFVPSADQMMPATSEELSGSLESVACFWEESDNVKLQSISAVCWNPNVFRASTSIKFGRIFESPMLFLPIHIDYSWSHRPGL
jgi:hypothetical protein